MAYTARFGDTSVSDEDPRQALMHLSLRLAQCPLSEIQEAMASSGQLTVTVRPDPAVPVYSATYGGRTVISVSEDQALKRLLRQLQSNHTVEELEQMKAMSSVCEIVYATDPIKQVPFDPLPEVWVCTRGTPDTPKYFKARGVSQSEALKLLYDLIKMSGDHGTPINTPVKIYKEGTDPDTPLVEYC